MKKKKEKTRTYVLERYLEYGVGYTYGVEGYPDLVCYQWLKAFLELSSAPKSIEVKVRTSRARDYHELTPGQFFNFVYVNGVYTSVTSTLVEFLSRTFPNNHKLFFTMKALPKKKGKQ